MLAGTRGDEGGTAKLCTKSYPKPQPSLSPGPKPGPKKAQLQPTSKVGYHRSRRPPGRLRSLKYRRLRAARPSRV